jgi:hypothetical protein
MPSAPPSQSDRAVQGDLAGQGARRREAAQPTGTPSLPQGEQTAGENLSLDSLQLLRAELTSVEDRAKLVIPVQLTGLVALWLSIVDFDEGVSRGLAGVGLALLLIAMFSSLYLVRPRSLLPLLHPIGDEPASGQDPGPGGVQVDIAMLSRSWVQEAERLRRCLLCAIILSAVALGVVIAAYVVDLFWGGPPPDSSPIELVVLPRLR